MKLRAAVLDRPGGDLTIRCLESEKLLPGHLLIKIFYSGVCRTQLSEVRGWRGVDRWIPHLLGHEASGEVIEIGTGVTKFRTGDEVILTWLKGPGLDEQPAKYKSGDLTINGGSVTTFSNYSVVSENRVRKKPKHLAFTDAVLYGCAVPTGVGLILNEAGEFESYDSVLIYGLGGVGFCSFLAALIKKPRLLVVVDRDPNRLEMAKALGATHALNSSVAEYKQQLSKISPKGFDFCVEAAGSVSTIQDAFSVIKDNGLLVFASHPPQGSFLEIDPHELLKGKKIRGSWGGGRTDEFYIDSYSDFFRKGNVDLSILYPKVYQLDEINFALNDLEQGKTLRPLVKMNHDW